MSWIFLCIIVALLFSISAFIDNYITDVVFKSKLPQAIKTVNGFFYILIGLLVLLLNGIETIPLNIAILAFLSGAAQSFSSIFYYLSLRDNETTTAASFIQLQPVLCFFADIYLMHKNITGQQIFGLAIIIIAPIIIAIAEKAGRQSQAAKRQLLGKLLLVVYVIISSISTIIYAQLTDSKHDYWSLFFWYILGRAGFDLISSLTQPRWRSHFKSIIREKPLRKILLLSSTIIIYTVGELIFKYGLGLTNSSFISAVTNATELVITFILGILLTIFWPNFGREKLDKRNILVHLVAVSLIVISIMLIQ